MENDKTPCIWNVFKANENLKKHNVSFEEAETVFEDPNKVFYYDDEHSYDEDRYVVVGISSFTKLLMVCHCYRQKDGSEIIRIISARKATALECEWYKRGGKF